MATYETRLEHLPVSINGIALGNAGIAIMWRNLCTNRLLYSFEGVDVVVYFFALYSLLLWSAYIARSVIAPAKLVADFSKPPSLAGLGAFTMNMSLLASLLASEVRVNIYFPIVLVLIAAALQCAVMSRFLFICWREKNFPEPFWYAAILSCVFPAITLPGDFLFCSVIRKFFIALGLLIIAPMMPPLVFRTMSACQKDSIIVANNPSIGLLQAGTSIICAGWCRTPLYGTPNDGGMGENIGHFLFALSTAGFALTVIANIQRRETLSKLGPIDGWASSTFPYCNTAIAAGLYFSWHFQTGSILEAWVLFLSVLASVIVIAVNCVFIGNLYFLRKPIAVTPSAMGGEGAHTTADIEPVTGTKIHFNLLRSV